jgi:hypothetical protein
VSVPDAEARAKQRKFNAESLTGLATFDERQLSAAHRVDLILLRNRFEADRWYSSVFRSWQWQPSRYNVADSFARQLDTEYAPVDTRPQHVVESASVCNTIIDVEIQTGDLDHEKAVSFRTREAYSERGRSGGKVAPGNVDPGSAGKLLQRIRRDHRPARRVADASRQGFQRQELQQQILSFGSAPVRDIRNLMREGDAGAVGVLQ